MKPRINRIFFSLIVIGSAAIAQAASFTWNGSTTGGLTGVSNIWDTTSANWTVAGPIWPAVSTLDDDATFAGTAGTVTMGSGVAANDLTFSTAGYKIDGGILTLNGTVASVITNAVTAEISSILAGSAGFTKAAAGTLVLSNSNSLSGTIKLPSYGSGSYLSDGIIRLTNSKAAGTSTLSIGGGFQAGRLELAGGITLSNAITLEGRQGQTYSAITNNGGDNFLTGVISFVPNGTRLNFNSSSGTLVISGAAMPGSSTGRSINFRGAAFGEFAKPITTTLISTLDKLDSGTWIISGNNTHTGQNTAGGGRLIVTSATGLGTGNVAVSTNATLDYAARSDAALAIGGTLVITGGTSTAIGASIGSTITSASINVTGAASITNAAHAVNLYKVPGTTAVTGTYNLITGGVGSALNPGTAPTLGKVYNNSDFTVGALFPNLGHPRCRNHLHSVRSPPPTGPVGSPVPPMSGLSPMARPPATGPPPPVVPHKFSFPAPAPM